MRINLSDQTDMMDLLGADLPASDGAAGHFAWSDGPLLQAIQQGHWVLLDELNLAGETAIPTLLGCVADEDCAAATRQTQVPRLACCAQ